MYDLFILARKNIRLFFKNIVLIPMFVGIPLFQTYMMSSMFDLDSEPATGMVEGFVKLTLIGEQMGTALDFPTVSVLVQFVLITSVVLGATMMTERQENTYLRILASPVKKWKVVVGNLLGNTLVVLMVSTFIMLGSYLVFDISWGSSMALLIPYTILLSFSAASILYFIASFFTSAKVAGGAMSLMVILMTFLSGGFTGEGSLPTLRYLTFNKYAVDGFLAIIREQSLGVLVTNALMLMSLAVLSVLAATIIYERRDLNG